MCRVGDFLSHLASPKERHILTVGVQEDRRVDVDASIALVIVSARVDVMRLGQIRRFLFKFFGVSLDHVFIVLRIGGDVFVKVLHARI